MKKSKLLKNWKLDLVLLMLFVLIGVFFIHSDFDLVGFAVIDLNETDLTEINESLGFELKESNNFSENLTLEFEEINITSLNETEEAINNINAGPERIEELSQGQAVVGESVKWVKNIKLENPTTGVSVKLPRGAQGIDVKKITGGKKEKIELDEIKVNKSGMQIPIQETNLITGGAVASFEGNWFLRVFDIIDSWFKDFTSVFGMVVFQEIEHEEFIEIIIEDEVEEIEIEYYTEGPKILEEEINNYKKRINVYSEISYENVSVQISVSELSKEKIKLYELIGGERILVEDISYIDKDSNGLIEEIGWIIPRLDDQTYELEITILNVQSYPVVGGNWAVRFTTIGEADLIVKAVNETTWSNVNELEDLKFLEIKCGEEVLDYSWIDDSVVVYNYSCDETGSEISKVLTSGVHDLEFTFGSQTAYAHNLAGAGNYDMIVCYDNATTASAIGCMVRNSTTRTWDYAVSNIVDNSVTMHMHVACNPVGDECALVTVQADTVVIGDDEIQISYLNLTTMTWWGNEIITTDQYSGQDGKHSAAVAYEPESGDLLVIYGEDPGSGGPKYREKPAGGSLGSEQEFFDSVVGDADWIEMYPDIHNPGDNIMVEIATRGADVNGFMWNGTNFTNEQALTTAVDSITVDEIEFTYVPINNQYWFAWCDDLDATGGARIRGFDRGTDTWLADTEIQPATGDECRDPVICGHQTDDKFTICVVDIGTDDANCNIYDISDDSWVGNVEITDDSANAKRVADCMWESDNDFGVIVYEDQDDVNLEYRTMTSAGISGSELEVGSTGNWQAQVLMIENGFGNSQNEISFLVVDNGGDLLVNNWNETSNSFGGFTELDGSVVQSYIRFWGTYINNSAVAAGDETNPSLTLDHPENITYDYNVSLSLNYTAADETELDTVWYNLDGGSNTTLTGNITFNTSEASHILNIWANDTTNNINSTSVSFNVDMTNPAVIWDSPTPNDDETISTNNVYLNVSVVDASGTSAFFDWNYSLVGYWSMDFYNDTGVFDNSSNSNFGEFGNGLSTSNITTGKFGNAIDFDKSADSFLNCSNNSIFGGMDELTIEAWVKWEGSVDADEDTIVSNWVGSGSRTYYLRWDSQTSVLEAYMQNSSGYSAGGGYENTDISDGGWHHVVFTYDGTDTFIYLDGVKSATAGLNAVFGKLDVAFMPLYIGNSPHLPLADSFDGLIDEVRIYSRALSPKEVNASYDNSVYRLENNFTDLSEGFYNYSAYAIDSAGNLNISDYRGVTVNAGCNVTLTSSHTMTDDLTCVNTAFNIGDNNVVLDCAGYDITYATAGTAATYGIDNNGNYDNITIKNCNITEGESGTSTKYGIDFGNAINSTVMNSTITTSGTNSIGIFFDSSASANRVLNNTVLTSGGTAHAIHLQTPNTNVTGNIVTTTGTSAIGIDVADGCVNNIVFNNTIITTNSDAGGIRITAASNNNVSKNTINTTGTDADAIYIAGNSDGNLIQDNTVTAAGGDGIELRKVFANSPNNNNISKNVFNNVNDYDLLIGEATDVTYLIDQVVTNYSFFSGGNKVHIENSTAGIVRFLAGVNGTGINLSDDIQIVNNAVTVKSDSNIGLNRSANLTFYSISGIVTPMVMRDGVVCSICSAVTNISDTYYFNVSSFTKYNISNNNSAPPQVTLSSPGDTTSTTDRTPTFTWNSVVDIDGDSVTYTINVDNDNDFSSCIINVSAIGGTTHTPAADLDIDDIYYWRVVAYDGEDHGIWSVTWSFDLNSLLIVDLASDTMDFGNVNAGTSYNTTTGSPNPFILQNDGNALANVSLNASSLFDSVSLPDGSYQTKIDNVTAEAGAFSWAKSLVSWFNMPSATTLAIVELKYEDATDSVETDILITPPLDELAGSKSSLIEFTSSLAE